MSNVTAAPPTRSQAPSRTRPAAQPAASSQKAPAPPADRFEKSTGEDRAWAEMRTLRQAAVTRPAPQAPGVKLSAEQLALVNGRARGQASPTQQAAARQLAAEARQGNLQALEMLRKNAQELPWERGLDVLAQAGEALQAQDYAAFLKAGQKDSPGFRALAEQARSGNPQALDALVGALGSEEQRYRALGVLRSAVGALRAQDVAALGALAREQNSYEAGGLLASAAMQEPPREGSAALVRTLLQDNKVSLEDRQRLEDWMARSDEGPARRQLAGAFLGSTRREVAESSQRALGAAVRAGDVEAIAELAKGGMTRELRSRTLEIFGRSVEPGNERTPAVQRAALGQLLQASQSQDPEVATSALQWAEGGARLMETQDYRVLGGLLNDRGQNARVRAAAASALGQAGVYLKPGYALDRVLEQLLPAASSMGEDNPAARAMGRLADKLEPQHFRALIGNLGPDSVRTLLQAPAEVRDSLTGDLREKLSGPRAALAAQVLTQLSPAAVSVEDLRDISDPAALGRVFDASENPAVRRAAAVSLARTIQPSDARWDAVLGEVANSRDAGAKATLSERLAASPLSPGQTEAIGRLMQSRLEKAITEEGQSDPVLREYAQLLLAQQWANDPQAKAHGQVDPERLKARLAEIEANPELRARLDDIRAGAVHDVTGQSVAQVSARTADYLRSPAFRQRLQLLEPAQAQAALTQEYARLVALDPERARKLEAHTEGLMLETGLSRLNADERKALLDTAVQAARQAGNHDLAAQLERQGQGPGLLDAAKLAPDLYKAFKGLRGDSTPPWLQGMLDKHVLGPLGLPQGAAGVALKGLGIFGAASAAFDSYNEFAQGDVGGGIGKGLMAVGGAFMLAPGVGWVIGGSLQLAGFLVNVFGGESPEETMLRQLGVKA